MKRNDNKEVFWYAMECLLRGNAWKWLFIALHETKNGTYSHRICAEFANCGGTLFLRVVLVK